MLSECLLVLSNMGKKAHQTLQKTPCLLAHSGKPSDYKALFSRDSTGNHELIEIPTQVLPALSFFSPHPIALIIIGGT